MSTRRIAILAVAVLLNCTLSLRGAPPPNDSIDRAASLPGAVGTRTATLHEATLDFFDSEPQSNRFQESGKGFSIWYTCTPAENGWLEITYDRLDSDGNQIVTGAYEFARSFGFGFYRELLWERRLEGASGRMVETIPCTLGVPCKIRFDLLAGSGGTDGGSFAFSYRLLTGSGFRAEGAAAVGRRLLFRESEDTVRVSVARTGSTEGSASVDYRLASDTADVAADLVDTGDPFSGTLGFLPGEASKELSFTINHDTDVEGLESFKFLLSNASEGSVILAAEKSVQLEDDDGVAPNDNFADAITLATGSAETLPNLQATREPGEPDSLFRTLWYRFTPPAGGLLEISLRNSFTGLGVFAGTELSGLSALSLVGGDFTDSQFGTRSEIYAVEGGVTYSIALSGYNGAGGSMTCNLYSLDSSDPPLSASFVRLSQDFYRGAKSDGPLTVKLLRTGNTDGITVVDFTTSKTTDDPEDVFDMDEGSIPFARPGVDYVVKTEQITFGPGETEKAIPITLLRGAKGPLRHFLVRIGTAQAHTLLRGGSSVLGPNNTTITRSQVYVADQPGVLAFIQSFDPGNFRASLEPTGPVGGTGELTLMLQPSGTLTGALMLDGQKLPFRNSLPGLTSFDATAVSDRTVALPRPGLPDASLQLHFQMDVSYLPKIGGRVVIEGNTVSTFEALPPAHFGPGERNSLVGGFTVELTGDAALPAAIRAPGCLALSVKASGAVTMVGGLSDGTAVSGSGVVVSPGSFNQDTPFLDVLISAPLYRGQGLLQGRLHLSYPGDPAATSSHGDGSGRLQWSHPARPSGPAMAAFSAQLTPFISRYSVPKGGLIFPALAAGAALKLELQGSTVPSPVTIEGTLTAANAVKFPPGTAGHPSVSFTKSTGLFTGKYTPSGNTKALSLRGVILRNQGRATGSFLNGPAAGEVSLGAP